MIHMIPSLRKNLFSAFLLAAALVLSGCLGREAGPTQAGLHEKSSPEKSAWHTRDLAPDHLSLARDLIQKEYYKVARVQLDQALKQGKASAEIYTLKGICARETGDAEKARAWLDKAIGLDSEYAPAFNHLGILQTLEKQWTQAQASFERATALDPANPDFFNNAGILFMEKEEFAAARNRFEQALALDPGYTRAANNLALALGRLGEFKQAFALLLSHYSYNIACHNMGVVYKEAGQKEKSFKMFLAARKEEPVARAQVMDPLAPEDPSPPEGLPGDTGNGIYSRIQDSLSNGGE